MEPVNPNPNLICTICFDIIKTAIQTPCGHVFCLSCLMQWTFHQVQPSVEFWLEGAPSKALIKEAFERIYVATTTVHIMSGKAFSRPMRAHQLSQIALFSPQLEDEEDAST